MAKIKELCNKIIGSIITKMKWWIIIILITFTENLLF
jgi:hypothetical protein